jgi:hypothetical protein
MTTQEKLNMCKAALDARLYNSVGSPMYGVLNHPEVIHSMNLGWEFAAPQAVAIVQYHARPFMPTMAYLMVFVNPIHRGRGWGSMVLGDLLKEIPPEYELHAHSHAVASEKLYSKFNVNTNPHK